MRRRNFSFRPAIAVVVRAESTGKIEARESEHPIAGCLQAVGNHHANQEAFASESPWVGFDPSRGVGIDHVPIVPSRLVLHVPGRMGQQVAVLVNLTCCRFSGPRRAGIFQFRIGPGVGERT